MSAEDLLAELDRPDWWRHAACVGLPIEWFYPDQGQKVDKRAKAACDGCVVRRSCLEAGLAQEAEDFANGDLVYGYRGGMSSTARRAELRRRRKEAA